MTHVRGNVERVNRTSVITDYELDLALKEAENIQDVFLRARAKAVISLSRLSGKRRGEIAMIPRTFFVENPPYLEVTFILEKKRKRNLIKKLSTKSFSLSDPLTQNIIEYLKLLDIKVPNAEFWLPSAKTVFGSYIIFPDKHLSGRHVFNIIRECSETMWPHLNRETVAADVVKQDDSINAIFKVQQTLDLEDFRTAFNYVKRFSKQVITRQNQT